MTITLTPKPAALKYALGDFELFRKTFRLSVGTLVFTEQEPPIDPMSFWEQVSAAEDGLVLRSCPIDAALPRWRRLAGAIQYVPAQYDRFHADLRGTFDEYLAGFKQKSRYKLKRMVKQFAKHSGGEVCWRAFRTADEIEDWYAQAREVSKLTYQERLMDAGLSGSKEFRDELLQQAAEDTVRGYLLYHEDEAIAYVYCTSSGGIVCYERLGFNPTYRKWSPGTVLQYFVLQDLFAEGRYRVFDFGQGGGTHKERFATGSTRCADIYCFRPTLRNRFRVRLHILVDSLSVGTGKLLDALRLKVLARRVIRGLR